ncbi:MAG: NOP5/NOP56 family protein, partial [Nitrososphaerales archaeon]
LMVEVGWVKDEDEARRLIRDFALDLSKARLRELAAKPDLQVMQSVQALDEVDKVVNIIEARVKEWYGLHFPELEGILDNPEAYVKFVAKFGRREKITKKEVEKLGFSPKKIKEMLSAAERSKGSEVRDEDLQRISALSEEAARLSGVRDGLAKHVESTMARIAPNVTSVAGATIGARLIAKAGGLEKMARLPASTIQVLGAEKALFRALRTGSRPPKHGILFQHQAVHSAPKWQRGKIARSLAAKLAIAARIDAYRGSREEGLKDSLEKRFEEIRQKYGEPPRSVKPEFKNRGKKSGEKKQRPAETQTGKARRRR